MTNSKCNGEADCQVHPHIRHRHPAKPVTVEYAGGEAVTLHYSDQWEAAEKEWERLSQSPEGRFLLDNLIVEGP